MNASGNWTNDAVQRVLGGAMESRIGSGFAFSFGDASGPICRGVGGRTHLDGPAVEETALWDLASVSKLVTGLAFVRLLEDGELHLAQRVDRFLDDFRASPAGRATLFELLTHTSGLPGRQPLFRTCEDSDAIRAAVRTLQVRAEPGSRVDYSSQGFMILGWILESVGRCSIAEALAQLVLTPFDLSDTGFRGLDAPASGTVATELCPWRGRVIHGTVHDENTHVMGGAAGHAGLFASLADMERLAWSLLQIHSARTSRPIGTQALRTSTRNYTGHLGASRGLAWQLAGDPAALAGDLLTAGAFGHAGFTGTSLFVDVTLERYGVLLLNAVHPSRHDDRQDDVTNRYFNIVASSGRS